MNIQNMTALELSRAIKNGELSCEQAVKFALDRVYSVDKKLNAFITVDAENALNKAREIQNLLDEGNDISPIAGVPIAVKDNICTKGIRTTCASKMLSDFYPIYNATVIERLEKAGAIIIGKTNMDEFAMGSTGETSYFGPCLNPHNLNRVSGGSSSGSAVSVASGESFAALGSDTGGSVRQPAAFCGVTGFKPTYGTVSRFGLIAYASSLDQIGPICKDVADCAAILDIIKGKDERDGTSLEGLPASFLDSLTGRIEGKRIAVPNDSLLTPINEDIKTNLKKVADTLSSLGAVVEYIDTDIFNSVVSDYYIIASAEASSNLSRYDGVKYGFRSDNAENLNELYKKSRTEGFGEEVKKRILLGTFVLSSGYYDAYYNKALKVKNVIKASFDELFKKYDAVLCPTAPDTAPLLNDSLKDPLKMYLSDVFTVSANLAGLPALSVPNGFTKDKMPTAAQIIGQRLDDAAVLNIGYAYQKATSFHKTVAEVDK